MTDRSRNLQRQLTKNFGAENAELRLSELASLLRAKNDSSLAGFIPLLERFPDFFSSLDRSYEDYDAQTKLAAHNLEKSSTELNLANTEMANLNLAIAAMLDSLDQGIFSFGQDGLCSSIYSKACLKLIETAPPGKHVSEVLNMSEDARDTVNNLLSILFNTNGSVAFADDFFALLPADFAHSKDLSVSLGYRAILDHDGKIQSILAIATDHTEEIEAVRSGREREAAAVRVLRISGNRNLFTRFYQSANIYFSVAVQTLSDHVPLEQVRRDVHTLKGNGSIFHLDNLVSILHDMETELAGVEDTQGARAVLQARLPAARAELLEIKKESVKILGNNFDRQGSMRIIPVDLLRSFAVELKASGANDPIAQRFVSLLMGEPIHKQLALFEINLQEQADRYGRHIAPSVFTGEHFTILTENYEALFSNFIHISRNILAHAIDSPETRQKCHKPEKLAVTIDTRQFERAGKKWFGISFTDDGLGINTVSLRAKIKTQQDPKFVDTLTDDQIMQMIFNDNLSTRDNVDELAGRGVGMGSIKLEAERLGGTVRVESELNRFTRITVEVPLIWL